MIKALSSLQWVILGAGTAFILLKSQWWSVMAIHPEKRRSSKRLIVGGAIARWILISTIFIAAGFSSISALLTVFASYMISRVLILFIWQKRFESNKGNIH
ncbi:MAG: hypothetical protein SVP52_03880 [Chloroflexota bacterium]|nr:hypothetical protein [Chloroflexota bacterium]